MQSDFESDSDIVNRASVEYGNLEPSREEKLLVTNFVRRIILKVPVKAKVSIELSAQKGFISSTITIQSVSGSFDASVVGETLEESLEFLQNDIFAKINHWKKQRFNDHPLAANN